MTSARNRVLLASLVGLICFAVVAIFEPWQVALLSATT